MGQVTGRTWQGARPGCVQLHKPELNYAIILAHCHKLTQNFGGHFWFEPICKAATFGKNEYRFACPPCPCHPSPQLASFNLA